MNDTNDTERQDTTETAPESSGQNMTFTQADVDRIVAERVRRATDAALTKALAKLGVPDLDTAAAALAAHQQRQQADMSEAEKAAAETATARQEAAALKAALEAERQQRLADRRDNALAQALASAQAIDADDVVTWLQKNAADAVSALVHDDGTIDPDGVTALVAKARSERPHFFRPGGPGSPSNKGGEVLTAPLSAKAQLAAQLAAQHGYSLDPRTLAARFQQHEDDMSNLKG